ncbi:MAG TPA: ATP-binding protein [Paucimonas sp.]|nr:ATP-binding protein [Paucimonas sp.]
MRNLPLGKRLFLLALAGILPLAAMSGIALLALVHQQRAQAEHASLEIVRALAIGVEGEIQRSFSALATLAAANSLERGDIAAFRMRTRRVMENQPHWLTIILADPQANVLLNTNVAPGERLPPVAEKESFEQAIRTRKPVVGFLARGQHGQFGVPLRVPVLRNGELRYILTCVIKPQAIMDRIERQRVPSDWVVSVFDAKGLRVARSRAHEKFIGKGASPSLQDLLKGDAREGTGITNALEGEPVYTAFTRLDSIGWTVAIGIPTSEIDMSGYRSLAVYGGGLLLSLALGMLASLAVARSINRPIGELRKAAQSLGHGGPVAVGANDIPETREVAEALAAAARQLEENASEREKLLADTEAARRQAEAANRTKDEFLAMLGHELRNPLAPMVNALELMNRRNHDPDARERQVIARQVAHLSRLVDDLLDVSRITKGKIQLQRNPIDLRTVAANALELTEPIFERRERGIDVELPDRPIFVDGDAVRLAQVLSNLLINAAKFTPPEGRIALRLRAVDDMAELAVEDSGCGIAADLLPHVFELFMQGRQSIDRRAGGLGLGLAIVKALVRMHGGTVVAESEGQDKGSRFVVQLPLCAGSETTTAWEPGPSAADDEHGRRILLVDDNADAAEILAQLLHEAAGCEVRTEANGPAALAALDAFLPDVAILDIGLPGMSGFELAQHLRRDARLPGLHIVALTGYGRAPDRARALDHGFDELLVKPVTLARLLAVIERLEKETSDRQTGP